MHLIHATVGKKLKDIMLCENKPNTKGQILHDPSYECQQ
jgi:hypothetical protein